MKTHNLKTHPDPFDQVWKRKKTAELRLDDRDFRIGDLMILREWKPRAKRFSGRWVRAEITAITWLGQWIPGVTEPYAMLSFKWDGRGYDRVDS